MRRLQTLTEKIIFEFSKTQNGGTNMAAWSHKNDKNFIKSENKLA